MASDDNSVRATNDDAASCKLSAVKLGYYDDPFVSFFVARPDRKAPIINRGYYTRVYAVERLVRKFLENGPSDQKRQIVNLGAGSDTLYWRLKSQGLSGFTFVEVDFEQVAVKKCARIRKHKELSQLIAEPFKNTGAEVHGADYHLITADLRDLANLETQLGGCLDFRIPTLFLTECVLIYLPPDKADAILRWISQTFSHAALANYEQINPNDAFGEVMLKNLQARQCPLLGIHAHPTLESQKQRMLQAGWKGAWAMDMRSVYNSIPEQERHRVSRLEFFDEYEEWDLMMSHYCLLWAWCMTSDQPESYLQSINLAS